MKVEAPSKDSSEVLLPEKIPQGKAEVTVRQTLNKVVFEALELTEEEQLAVYQAVVELVKNRLVKARSV